MKKYSLHIGCLLILLFPALTAPAQTAHGVTTSAQSLSVHASVDQQKILIGQPFHLLLEATVTGNAPLAWPESDSLPHFIFLDKGRIDTVVNADGRYYRQSLTVTSFDSGAWAIPRLLFTAGTKRATSDSVRVEVDFSKFDPGKDYHDIRDIIDIPNPYIRYIGWILGAVVMVSLTLVIWMIGRKRLIPAYAPPPEAAAPALPPYEEALAQMDELARQQAWANAPVKIYYTRLNDILRLFILRRLGIASLAETNEELIGQLRSLPLGAEAFSRLAQSLRMSDFVKFAKYQPPVGDNEDHFQVMRASVEALNRIGLEREAERLIRLAAAQSLTASNNKNNTP